VPFQKSLPLIPQQPKPTAENDKPGMAGTVLYFIRISKVSWYCPYYRRFRRNCRSCGL